MDKHMVTRLRKYYKLPASIKDEQIHNKLMNSFGAAMIKIQEAVDVVKMEFVKGLPQWFKNAMNKPHTMPIERGLTVYSFDAGVCVEAVSEEAAVDKILDHCIGEPAHIAISLHEEGTLNHAKLEAAEEKIAACSDYLKEHETPAECIKRNRDDTAVGLRMVARALKRAEEAEAIIKAISEKVDNVITYHDDDEPMHDDVRILIDDLQALLKEHQ